jgi:hypothetical protein
MNLEDVDTLFVDADPATGKVIPSGSSAEARWRYAQLTGQPVGQTGGRRRALFMAGILIPIAAALALVLVNVLPGPTAPKSAAAAVLEQAAAAAGQSGTPLTSGQYLYTETQSQYEVTLYNPVGTSGAMAEVATAQFIQTQEAWTDSGGTGHDIQTDGSVQFPSAADEAAWNASPSGKSMLAQIANFAEEGSEGSTVQPLFNVSKLPTDISTLTAVIANGALQTNVDEIPAGPSATFERAAALLIGPNVGMTPALASALFHVLANQPGVQLLGTVTDHNGQQGVGVGLATAHGTNVSEVVVDPSSGSLLEARFALPAATIPPNKAEVCTGAVDSNAPPTCTHGIGEAIMAPVWTDVVATGVVDSGTATVPPVGNASTVPNKVPGAPSGLVATPEPNQVALSWNVPTNSGGSPITDYVVSEYTGGSIGSGPSGVFDMRSAATKYTWQFLTDGQPYTFTVQAISADGYGAPSSSVTARP